MKLREDDNVVLSNTKNETRFTINASAKAFKILSDSLYSRKIEAIVRELSCNAYDSHVQAGCPDRKFELTLPSVWTPEFVVEDFGVGLDADDIENIYTSYFTSTKTDSNDVIGALGLGSKTPFSYTNTFNITSRKNGVEYTYNAYINSSGEPSVSLLSSSPTDKCNGVRISVPVRESDFWQFRTDVVKVISWFHNAPVINNLIDTIDNSNAVRLKELRYFWKHDRYSGDTVTAVMGNVAYVISDVSEKFNDHFNSGELAFIENNRIFIEFDIGDLDVAASRETISFDEHTIEVFVSKLKDVITLIANSKFEQSALKEAYILCNPKLMVEEITNGQLKVDLNSSTIMYSPEDGSTPYAVSDKLSSRMINVIKENGVEGASSILNFLNKLMLNPSYRAVNELYGFLQHNDIKLAENGNFYAWKVVRSDYMDKYSNTMLNAVGTRVEVPRNQVDEDSEKTCSFGLHVCAKHYVSSYGGGDDRVVMVEVNPADVCAIPKDYNDSKMRCAGYDVVKDVTELFFS